MAQIFFREHHVTKEQLLSAQKSLASQPLLIRPPRKRLLTGVILLWMVLFLFAAMSYGFLLFVSLELYVFFVYFYYSFTKKWNSHGYSALLLHSSTFVVWLMSIIEAGTIRHALITLLYAILY